MFGLIRQINGLLARIPDDLVSLALRIFPAMVFFQSGRTKVEGLFTIKDSTWFLFEHEYALPLIPSNIAAIMGTTAEHVLPVLMILGLGTRVSALGLLAMTVVIQTFVYPDAWVTHGLWASALLAVVARGPGALSLDRLFGLDGQTARGAAPLVRAV
jgi:putative oxidoreductase